MARKKPDIGAPSALIDAIARAIASAGGAGYSPLAPGTCGTAVAVLLARVLAPTPWWGFGLITAAVIAVGIWASSVADRSWGTHDSGRIVIDEVAGYFVTVAVVDRTDWLVLTIGFVLFRIFDITKPPPVRAIDRKVGGGAGVVLDDVAAGVYAMVVLVVLVELNVPNWLRQLLAGS
jgi:phosphatidylglycerophosphatase A